MIPAVEYYNTDGYKEYIMGENRTLPLSWLDILHKEVRHLEGDMTKLNYLDGKGWILFLENYKYISNNSWCAHYPILEEVIYLKLQQIRSLLHPPRYHYLSKPQEPMSDPSFKLPILDQERLRFQSLLQNRIITQEYYEQCRRDDKARDKLRKHRAKLSKRYKYGR